METKRAFRSGQLDKFEYVRRMHPFQPSSSSTPGSWKAPRWNSIELAGGRVVLTCRETPARHRTLVFTENTYPDSAELGLFTRPPAQQLRAPAVRRLTPPLASTPGCCHGR